MKKAFTLIELLVVVLIIGILAAVALPQYQKVVEKSRIAAALPVMDNVKKNMELYLTENGWNMYTGDGYIFTPTFLWVENQSLDELAKKIETAIDVRAGLDCSGEGYNFCHDGNFYYTAQCYTGECWIRAGRSMEAYNDEGDYSLMMHRYPSTNQWEYECYYYDDFGQRACSTLQGQGNWQIIDGNE